MQYRFFLINWYLQKRSLLFALPERFSQPIIGIWKYPFFYFKKWKVSPDIEQTTDFFLIGLEFGRVSTDRCVCRRFGPNKSKNTVSKTQQLEHLIS